MEDQSPARSAAADADLVLRTRSGDAEAFGELWRRHYRSGMTVARSITSSIDPDDLVQESYSRIYQAILKGGGPNGSFRAYLFTSIRNTAAAWGRARRETTIDELETVADPASTDSAANEELDRGLTAQAFRSLPSRWQEVLWYSEIEQMKPAAIGALLGMSAGAVSQLTFRAREGLREAWIQAHLRSVGEGSDCQWTIEHLGAYSRGNLGARAQQRIDDHLEGCARCMIVAAEAKDVSSRLALVLLPLVLGVTGASAYLAALQGGGTPLVALAAMPSSVVEGAVVAGTTGGGVAAGSAVTSGAAGSGSAGGSGASSASGSMPGIGALVGAGSAALVIAGVVAAAAVVPGMLSGAPATSQPSASESEPSSISSEVVPDSTMSADTPMVIDAEEQPPAPKDDAEVKADAQPPAPPQHADVTEPAIAKPAPTPTPTPTPTPDPEPTPSPEPTPTPTPTPDPGEDGGAVDPGGENPEAQELTWGTADVVIDTKFRTHYLIPVQGTPGSVVQVWMDAVPARGAELTLSPDGTGTADLRPNAQQLFTNAEVGFRYVVDGVPGDWSSTNLWSLHPLLGAPAPDAPATAAPTPPAE
ncbi:sigma-70 family RNA polymerase sigma factor [Microbacterium sp. 69-10]|uniref:sigma-70 family RNA polymerase sigma factor n=1 Tax=Microbacterium sp. 69-10 TaxID=1895783 RepID=UPI0034121EEB